MLGAQRSLGNTVLGEARTAGGKPSKSPGGGRKSKLEAGVIGRAQEILKEDQEGPGEPSGTQEDPGIPSTPCIP